MKMMTPLEQAFFFDGFLTLLLAAEARPADGGFLAWNAVLFDGGRKRAATAWSGSWNAPDPQALAALRGLLLKVLPPPHVLTVWGTGRNVLLESLFAERLHDFRTVDLAETAAALFAIPASAGMDGMLRAAGCGPLAVADSAGPDAAAAEELLWAVLAAAGKRGVTPAALPGFAAAARAEAVRFEQAGGPLSGRDYPESPAVYLMRDRHGRVLYVGKAANLARRLAAYFRHAWRLPEKIRRLRRDAATVEFIPVGSELEALLLEQRLITELAPELNVQRGLDVAEAPGLYQAHAAVVLVEPSGQAGALDLFLIGPRPPLLQFSVGPARWPLRTLHAACLHILGLAGRRPHAPRLHAWDAAGHTIARRYFARFHNRLRWVGLDAVDGRLPAELDAGLRAAAAAVRADPAAARFLLRDDLDAPRGPACGSADPASS